MISSSTKKNISGDFNPYSISESNTLIDLLDKQKILFNRRTFYLYYDLWRNKTAPPLNHFKNSEEFIQAFINTNRDALMEASDSKELLLSAEESSSYEESLPLYNLFIFARKSIME